MFFISSQRKPDNVDGGSNKDGWMNVHVTGRLTGVRENRKGMSVGLCAVHSAMPVLVLVSFNCWTCLRVWSFCKLLYSRAELGGDIQIHMILGLSV